MRRRENEGRTKDNLITAGVFAVFFGAILHAWIVGAASIESKGGTGTSGGGGSGGMGQVQTNTNYGATVNTSQINFVQSPGTEITSTEAPNGTQNVTFSSNVTVTGASGITVNGATTAQKASTFTVAPTYGTDIKDTAATTSNGVANTLARSDHVHKAVLSATGANGITVNGVTSAQSGTVTITPTYAAVASIASLGTAAAAGVADTSARGDHVHPGPGGALNGSSSFTTFNKLRVNQGSNTTVAETNAAGTWDVTVSSTGGGGTGNVTLTGLNGTTVNGVTSAQTGTTFTVSPTYAAVGAITGPGTSAGAGSQDTAARGDHQHPGPTGGINSGSLAAKSGFRWNQGTNVTITDSTAGGVQDVTINAATQNVTLTGLTGVFVNGSAAAQVGQTFNVSHAYAAVGAITSPGTAAAAGTADTVARGDHQHPGPGGGVNLAAVAPKSAFRWNQGTGILISDSTTAGTHDVTVTAIGGTAGNVTVTGAEGITVNGLTTPQVGATFSITPTYAPVGQITGPGTAAVAGVQNTAARGDHQHPGQLTGINQAAGTATTRTNFVAGTNITLAELESPAGTHNVTITSSGGGGTGNVTITGLNGTTVNGVDAVAQVGSTFTVTPTYALVAAITTPGTAAVAGVADTAARGDHQHPGALVGINQAAGTATKRINLVGGTNITLTDLESPAGTHNVTITGPVTPSQNVTLTGANGITINGVTSAQTGTTFTVTPTYAVIGDVTAVGNSSGTGSADRAARADHTHQGVKSLTGLNGVFANGLNGSSQSDTVNVTIGYGVVGDVASLGTAAAAGVADRAARGDHVHPGPGGALNGSGSFTTFNRLRVNQGANITVSEVPSAGTWDVTITTTGILPNSQSVTVSDEGTSQGQAQNLNFVGGGVTAVASGGTATITIPTGAGGVSSAKGQNGITVNGVDNVAATGTITVTPTYALVGAITTPGTAAVAGVADTAARGDHQHPGELVGINQASGTPSKRINLVAGTNITLAELESPAGTHNVTLTVATQNASFASQDEGTAVASAQTTVNVSGSNAQLTSSGAVSTIQVNGVPPSVAGDSGKFLTNNGSGVNTWGTPAGGSSFNGDLNNQNLTDTSGANGVSIIDANGFYFGATTTNGVTVTNPQNTWLSFGTNNVTVATLAATTAGRFGAGTAAAPSVTNNTDPDTGIYWPSANTVALVAGATETLTIGATTVDRVILAGGTMAAGKSALLVNGTLASATGPNPGVLIDMTPTGSNNSNSTTVFKAVMEAGYTGSAGTVAIRAENDATGSGLSRPVAGAANLNSAITGVTQGADVSLVGSSVGVYGIANGALHNYGMAAVAVGATSGQTAGTNVGILASAVNTAGDGFKIAGQFQLANATEIVGVSAAILASNAALALPIQLWYDNTTEVLRVDDGGDLKGTALDAAGARSWSYVDSGANVCWKVNSNGVQTNRIAGTATITNATSSLTVTLPDTMPDTSYHVSYTFVSSSTTQPTQVYISSRTTTTFVMSWASNPVGNFDITYECIDY